MTLYRLRALLAALWGGLLLCIAGVAAPAAFAVLERAQAGKLVARLFERDAQIGLLLGLLLMMMERRLQRDGQEREGMQQRAVFNPELLLPLLAMVCVVAGYYALQGPMQAAREGQGSWSFAALHGISLLFFGIKTAAVLMLAWRAARPMAAISLPASS
ncbi:DUF4149 domain-containing protein [Paucibacter sp. APW11]|uniref:DUF4149 domain-containing protein n=1 Tax=Roseateles aquae TaxID=3077235 RepID=A0ABU3P609_9BURK|nr:DUF4149 domain-containing protein [Paucibacter sp. APW11]MDT8997998.1 DUF4149 domain-containing protein [Paucibacter sp. APW11]